MAVIRCPFCGSEDVINGGTMRRCVECGEPWLAGDEGVLDPNPPVPTSIEEDT